MSSFILNSNFIVFLIHRGLTSQKKFSRRELGDSFNNGSRRLDRIRNHVIRKIVLENYQVSDARTTWNGCSDSKIERRIME